MIKLKFFYIFYYYYIITYSNNSRIILLFFTKFILNFSNFRIDLDFDKYLFNIFELLLLVR